MLPSRDEDNDSLLLLQKLSSLFLIFRLSELLCIDCAGYDWAGTGVPISASSRLFKQAGRLWQFLVTNSDTM
jgi:hypothetical protein